MSERHVPLYVDLDGTLIKTDLLLEGAIKILRQQPWIIFLMMVWLFAGGKARLKAELARRVDFQAASLPYHPAFVNWLRAEHAAGRRLILASASDQRYAESVASHLGIFADVLASDGKRNLAGARKLEAIVEHGKGDPFDYAGNAWPDLSVWPSAAAAVVVDPEPGVLGRVRQIAMVEKVFDTRKRGWRVHARALRMHQWLKNCLLGVPLLTAHKLQDFDAIASVALLFVAFGLVASATYILNDLFDLADDRQHPSKRGRPIAAGDLSISRAAILSFVSLVAGLSLGAALSASAFCVLVAYLVLTLTYSLRLKRYMLLDVFSLASLYTLRIIAGALAIHVNVSNWLLAFSMFIFLSLALVKRCAELQVLAQLGRDASSGRDYRVTDYPVFMGIGLVSGYLSILVIALFIDATSATAQYANPRALWFACPLFLYWVSRIWVKTARGEMHEDPLIFSLRDRASWLVFAGVLATVMIAQWRVT